MSEEKNNFQRQADRTKPNSKRSVTSYLLILFAAAIVLLLLAYLMQQRSTSEQALSGLQQSISAMQNAQEVYEENGALKEQIAQLEDQIRLMQDKMDRQEGQNAALNQQLEDLKKSTQALDWFWQINEAYVRGRHSLCNELIDLMNASGLTEYLPRESITDNERFSPYDRYQEIYDALH